MALKRELGLFQATMMGVGIIVGAGIYVLVGVAAPLAGNALWLSFALAGALALLMSLTYAELGSIYPRAGSSYYYAKEAFGSKTLGFLMGWILAVASMLAAATVALGFATYLNAFVPLPLQAGALALLAVLFVVNSRGIRQASGLNVVCTLAEVTGLLIVLYLAFSFAQPSLSFESPSGFGGIASAAALVFFAYLGFETLAAEAEEMKDARRTLPRAILLSVVICTVLYVAVAVAYAALVPASEFADLAGKPALALAAGKAGGAAVVLLLSAIALFSTANTALVSLLGASRTVYGMARDKALPGFLSKTVHSVPLQAVAVSTAVAAALAFLGSIELAAEAGVMAMFVLFIVDNAALIKLRLEGARGEFRAPFSVRGVPLTAVLAIIGCAALMAHEFYSKPVLFALTFALVGAGFLFYEAETHAPAKAF